MLKSTFNKVGYDADHHHFKDHASEQRLFKRRVVVAVLLVVCALLGLSYRFHDLQVDQYQSYITQSENNRIQLRPVLPNRGLIIDGRGRIIAENKERSKIIFQALDKLPESQQTAYTLHKLEGLGYEEIGSIMKKSVSSIESLMHRAKGNLQNYLYDYYNSDRKFNSEKTSN